MWTCTLISVALLFSTVSAASVAPVEKSVASAGQACVGQVTFSETYIGQDQNVKLQFATCPEYGTQIKALEGRQLDVCGNTCTTSCFTPSGGGPNPNDCHIIADALRFDSQRIGALFTIGTGTNNTVVVQYASCLSFFVNQEVAVIEYCRSDWANLIDFIAPNCQATQNARGGLCVATNQQWFAQVNHS
ncbi:hypothetical protein DFH09DRAFT_1322838 [Mycena vulgaris]|nr:hypothetical protein DFH09DRAFT_1322838 [Mycena vulgaris]